jgi:hypothetical protein
VEQKFFSCATLCPLFSFAHESPFFRTCTQTTVSYSYSVAIAHHSNTISLVREQPYSFTYRLDRDVKGLFAPVGMLDRHSLTEHVYMFLETDASQYTTIWAISTAPFYTHSILQTVVDDIIELSALVTEYVAFILSCNRHHHSTANKG